MRCRKVSIMDFDLDQYKSKPRDEVGKPGAVMRDGREMAVHVIGGHTGKRSRKPLHVQVPEEWLTQLANVSACAFKVAVLIRWRSFRNRNVKAFTLGDLNKFGVSRYKKVRALAELEAAGLIRVTRSHNKYPWVEII